MFKGDPAMKSSKKKKKNEAGFVLHLERCPVWSQRFDLPCGHQEVPLLLLSLGLLSQLSSAPSNTKLL